MSRNIESGGKDRRGKIEFAAHKNIGEAVLKRAKPLRLEEVLAERGDNVKDLGLYVHIPFCSEICSFCAFHRNIGGDSRKENFVGSLETHIDKTLGLFQPDQKISKIFYGGGTPSLLGLGQVERLQEKITSYGDTNDAEITFELHPENITEEYITGLQQAGIKRFSVGVQNFSTDERNALHRSVTSVEEDLDRLQMLNRLGVQYNVDLMFGTPNQTKGSWEDTYKRVIEEIHPPEITTYQYVNAYGAVTRQQIARGLVARPDLKTTHQMYRDAQDHFTSNGYKQSSTLTYETEDTPARTKQPPTDFLGLGPRTYSKIGPWMFLNTGKTNDFATGSDTTEFFGAKLPNIVEKGLEKVKPIKSTHDGSKISLGAWKSEAISQVYGAMYYVLNQRAYPGSMREHTIIDLKPKPKQEGE